MARIAGVDLPRNKRVEIALQYIYGIGKTQAKNICEFAKLPAELRSDDLTDNQIAKITLFPYTTLFRSVGRASCRERV